MVPRSLMMDFGKPNFEKISSTRSSPSSSAAILVLHGISLTIFEYRSTTTNSASYAIFLRADGGSPVTKSKEMSVHGPSGCGIGINKP